MNTLFIPSLLKLKSPSSGENSFDLVSVVFVNIECRLSFFVRAVCFSTNIR